MITSRNDPTIDLVRTAPMSARLALGAGFIVTMCQTLGCATAPAPTGFLSDYSKLREAKSGAMRYISPRLSEYSRFMIAPVEIRVERDALSVTQRAEVARYMRTGTERVLRGRGYKLVSQSDAGVARVRIAITDVQKAKWYLNLNPVMKVTGAGTGGASMEAEIVDAVTGEQLAAVIQAGRGNQFELDTFSALDDVKDVIDRWCEAAGARFDELRAGKSR